MNEPIPEGGFIVARKIYRSKIWLKQPSHLKVWLWILGQANHSNHEKNGRIYKRGELVTTYDEIIKGTAHYFNRRHILLTLKQIRIILDWLEAEGMISVQPLRPNAQNAQSERLTRAGSGADLKTRTRAYLGIRIIVVNYDTYQDSKSYKGRPQNTNQGIPSVQLGHDNNNGNNVKKKIYAHFAQFWAAYPLKVNKKRAFEAWQKLSKKSNIEELLPIILQVIEAQKRHKEEKKARGEFVAEWPHPTTWLNDERWNDETGQPQKRWDQKTY